MSNLKRYYSKGNIYFVTCVTYQRKPILIKNPQDFKISLNYARRIIPFRLIAWVLLPDHLHIIIDPQGSNLSYIIMRFKQKFAGIYRSRNKLKSGRIWQHRFWDHIIRDQNDLNRHIDYIHFNPVKHGLTTNPLSYRESSFYDYVQDGYYQSGWGIKEPDYFVENYGE